MMDEPLPFEIQKAGWHDLNELRKLEQVCFGEDAWPFWDLIAVLTLPKIIRLKAVFDGKMVGFIAGDPNQSENVGWIATLGVLPEYRRKGIAEILLAECESHLSFSRIRLSVRKNNEAALNLYRKAGYQAVDLWHNYYHSGEDALVLEKRR
jgi:ribosomal protein S18 acetylase RimI-like enzyme